MSHANEKAAISRTLPRERVLREFCDHGRLLVEDVRPLIIEVLDELRYIAETPEPLNNKGSALRQCAFLKDRAMKALSG